MSSILNDIKKPLGIESDDVSFDTDIIMHINTALFDLNQLGVGPEEGFSISDDTSEWSSMLLGAEDLESIKTYVYLKTRLIFDPPATSYVIECYERQIQQLAWRITNQAESEG